MGVPLMNNEVFSKVCMTLMTIFGLVGLVIWVCSL